MKKQAKDSAVHGTAANGQLIGALLAISVLTKRLAGRSALFGRRSQGKNALKR